MIRTIAATLLAIFITTSCLPAVAADVAAIGKPAPTFSLPSAAGSQIELSKFIGKIVVLEWYNPGCPFVKKFYKGGDMQKLQADARSKDVVWLTISSSAEGRQGHIPSDEAIETAKEHGINPDTLLLDHPGSVGRAYGARTTPHMFVIDSKGILAYSGAIDNTPSTSSSDIAQSSNYVSAAINALKQGANPAPQSTDPYGCSVKY